MTEAEEEHGFHRSAAKRRDETPCGRRLLRSSPRQRRAAKFLRDRRAHDPPGPSHAPAGEHALLESLRALVDGTDDVATCSKLTASAARSSSNSISTPRSGRVLEGLRRAASATRAAASGCSSCARRCRCRVVVVRGASRCRAQALPADRPHVDRGDLRDGGRVVPPDLRLLGDGDLRRHRLRRRPARQQLDVCDGVDAPQPTDEPDPRDDARRGDRRLADGAEGRAQRARRRAAHVLGSASPSAC